MVIRYTVNNLTEATEMTILTEKQKTLLDQLLEECGGDVDALMGSGGLIDIIRKRFIEAALEGEITDHLGYGRHDPAGNGSGNSRNGHTTKTVQSKDGPLRLDIPRDRNGTFEPKVVKKRQRRLGKVDDAIIRLYTGGLSTRAIQAELKELYDGVEVSHALISEVTDSVLAEMKEWLSRPLDAVYPVIYFDCIHAKSRQDGSVRNKAVYVALGINTAGEKDCLGLWMEETEGAKFWLKVFTNLKERGVDDCFIACVDGLKGLPEAIETVFPQARVQLCIVHQVRNSLKYVPHKDRKAVAADLRAIYSAPDKAAAEDALQQFSGKWNEAYPAIAPAWERNWERLTPFFDYPPAIRKAIYTTNAVESLNYSLRRLIRNRGAFPNDEAVMKLFYLGLRDVSKRWTRPIKDWKAAMNQFIILYGDRVPA